MCGRATTSALVRTTRLRGRGRVMRREAFKTGTYFRGVHSYQSMHDGAPA